MFGGLLLALATTLIPLSSPPQQIAPLVPAQHFHPVSIPFEYFNRHIYISLTLNGTTGMVFLLDSGTNRNVLNLRTSEALGLKPVSIEQAKGLGLGSGKVHVAAAKDIDARIGNIQVANLMAVVDLRGLEEHFGHRVDGILGFPFLQRFVVVLDFNQQTLTLRPSRRYTYRGSGDTVYLLQRSKSLSIPVTLGDSSRHQRRARVQIDTGSDVTLLLYQGYVHGAHLQGVFSSSAERQAYGLGGYFSMQLGLLHSLTMGRTLASHLAIFQLKSDPGRNSDSNCVGAIGTSLLDQFQKIVFDVPGDRVIFELKPSIEMTANGSQFAFP